MTKSVVKEVGFKECHRREREVEKFDREGISKLGATATEGTLVNGRIIEISQGSSISQGADELEVIAKAWEDNAKEEFENKDELHFEALLI